MAVPIPSEAFEVFDNNEITREKIEQVATLFSQEYGIWGPKGPRPGKRICMSALKLEDQIFPELSLDVDEQFERASEYRLVRSLMDGEIIGHATACYWKFVVEELGIAIDICWVTQLVVKKDWRGRGIAKQMLGKLNKEPEEGHRYGRPGRTYYGILSSSPFAIMAAWRAFGQADSKFLDRARGQHTIERLTWPRNDRGQRLEVAGSGRMQCCKDPGERVRDPIPSNCSFTTSGNGL